MATKSAKAPNDVTATGAPIGVPLYDISTLWELVRRRAESTPAAPMLFDEQGRRVRFAEFALRAERVSSWSWGSPSSTATA